MNNLEHIDYASVVHPSLGGYQQWRKNLRPRYLIAWRDIFLGYLTLTVILFAAAQTIPGSFIFFVVSFVCSVFCGFTLAYLALFLHEAGHYNLHPDKKTNDLLATIFLGLLFGQSIQAYRKIHWQHHQHLGLPVDTENSYFNALTWSFLLESFTGIHLVRVMFQKNKHLNFTKKQKQKSLLMLALGLLFNLSLLFLLFELNAWGSMITWVAGMFIFFPFFATIRQLLEHRDELAERRINYRNQPHGKLSRLFGSGVFSRAFGGAGFNKHMIHHWDPQISYTRLDDVETFLSECDTTKEIVTGFQTTYFKTAKKLLRSK